jgi:hypothetical protein
MPWVSGVYTRGYPSWSADAASNLPISATKFDTEDNDFASGLNNCLTIDGLNKPNTSMTWSLASAPVLTLNRSTTGGTALAVGFTGGTNNPSLQVQMADGIGATLNLSTSQSIFVAINGTNVAQFQSTGFTSLFGASFTGAANAYALTALGSSTSGQSLGLLIEAGTTSGDFALKVQNQAASATFLTINGAGAVTINAPATGNVALTMTGVANTNTLQVQAPNTSGQSFGEYIQAGTTAADYALLIANAAASHNYFTIKGDGSGYMGFNGAANTLQLSAAGNVVIPAPASGVGVAITGLANAFAQTVTAPNTASQSFGLQIKGGTNGSDGGLQVLSAAGTVQLTVQGDGGLLLAAATGGSQGLGSLNATALFVNGAPVYSGIPQNLQTANYQLVLADAGKHVLMNATGHTITIPANASVAFPVGTAITLVSGGTSTTTIAITSDNLDWSPSGGAGSRTLAPFGVATLLKVAATTWFISGTGLS